MQKKFLSSLFLILGLNLLVKPFYIIGIEAEVQNQVGSAAYGMYFALLNLSFLFNIVLDIGINNFNTKNIAETPILAGKQIGMLLGIRMILFFIYVFVTLLSGFIIGYDSHSIAILFWLIGNQFLVATLQFLRSNFTGLHLFKWDSLFSVLDRILLILICSALLWSSWLPDGITIYHFIGAQSIAYGVAVFIAFIVLTNVAGKIGIRVKKLFSLAIFRKSWPYALLILLMMFYNRVDGIMLERLSPNGATDAGYYAQGFRLFDAVNMIALLFAGLLLPIYAKMIKNNENVSSMVSMAANILLPGGIIIGMVCYAYGFEIINARYVDATSDSQFAFGLLILSAFPVFTTYIYGTLLTAAGKLKFLNWSAGIGIIANIILNVILIPEYGAVGAATATLATQSLTALFQYGIAQKNFKLPINYGSILRYVILIITVFGFIYLFEYSPLVWYINITLVLLISSLSAMILKLWNIREIFTLLRSSDKMESN